jgi:sterol desaturase/sphingolipid hydroxylase (fatty acid hydroxylase superfamily)
MIIFEAVSELCNSVYTTIASGIQTITETIYTSIDNLSECNEYYTIGLLVGSVCTLSYISSLKSKTIGRKCMHIGMGCCVLYFESVMDINEYKLLLPVVGITMSSVTLLPLYNFIKYKDANILTYIMAVIVTLWSDIPLVYIAPMFFSDPMASLVGKSMSKLNFNMQLINSKSLAGSLTAAVVSIILLYPLYGNISILYGIVLAYIELVVLYNDNLYIWLTLVFYYLIKDYESDYFIYNIQYVMILLGIPFLYLQIPGIIKKNIDSFDKATLYTLIEPIGFYCLLFISHVYFEIGTSLYKNSTYLITPSITTYLLEVLYFIVSFDTMFYFSHRFIWHHPKLYKYYHKIHHINTNLHGMSGFYANFLELATAKLYILIPLVFYKPYLYSLYTFFMFFVIHNLCEHEPLFGFTFNKYHIEHHRDVTKNFGFVRIWDILLGSLSTKNL